MKQRWWITVVNNRSRGRVTDKYWALSWNMYLSLHTTPCYKIPYKLRKLCAEWKITQQTLLARQALAEGLWREGPIVFARPLPILIIFSAPGFPPLSVPLGSHHFSVNSIIQKIWGTKGKYWALNSHNVFPRAQPSTPGPPLGGSFSLRRALCLLLGPPHITMGQSQAPQPRSHLLINALRM